MINWTFKILVARSSLPRFQRDFRFAPTGFGGCSLLVVDKSNIFASSQSRRIYPPALWQASLLFLIKMMEYLPARASQWQAGLILTRNQ